MDPYTYPGTNILRNKFGIRDREALKELEYQLGDHRVAELRDKPITGKFDLDHLKAIHAHIFQDTYEWAGQLRSVNISKGGTRFCQASFIEGQARTLAVSLTKERNLHGLEKPQFVERLAHYYAEWNAVHPFREGNGRSTREFIGQLAREAGYELQQARIDNNKDQWNQASERSFHGDLSGIREIFTEAVRPSRALAYEKLPEPQALAKHPELKSAYEAERAMQGSPANRGPGNDQARAEIIRQLDAGQVPTPSVAREAKDQATPATGDRPQPEPPERAKAFQAVADNRLSREAALKVHPELRPAFNQLAVAKLENAKNPDQVHAVRENLQAALNAGHIPAPGRAAPQLAVKPERER